MSQGISSSSEGRLGRGPSRASKSSYCRHRTSISVRQLVRSIVLVMTCSKAVSNYL